MDSKKPKVATLPQEIIDKIIATLHGKRLIQCKIICKAWNKTVKEIESESPGFLLKICYNIDMGLEDNSEDDGDRMGFVTVDHGGNCRPLPFLDTRTRWSVSSNGVVFSLPVIDYENPAPLDIIACNPTLEWRRTRAWNPDPAVQEPVHLSSIRGACFRQESGQFTMLMATASVYPEEEVYRYRMRVAQSNSLQEELTQTDVSIEEFCSFEDHVAVFSHERFFWLQHRVGASRNTHKEVSVFNLADRRLTRIDLPECYYHVSADGDTCRGKHRSLWKLRGSEGNVILVHMVKTKDPERAVRVGWRLVQSAREECGWAWQILHHRLDFGFWNGCFDCIDMDSRGWLACVKGEREDGFGRIVDTHLIIMDKEINVRHCIPIAHLVNALGASYFSFAMIYMVKPLTIHSKKKHHQKELLASMRS